MRAREVIAAAAAVMTLTFPAPAESEGQTGDGTQAVSAAIEALQGDYLPIGPVTVDPRPLTLDQGSPRLSDTPDPARAELLAEVIGDATVSRIDDNVHCATRLPTSCALHHGVAAIAVSDVELTEGQAVVYFRIRAATDSPRQPVSSSDLQVRLKKEQDGWDVTEVTALRLS